MAHRREVRSEIRRLLAGLHETDLDQPVFVPLMGAGWMPLRSALGCGIAHHWNHFTQLRLYLKRSTPIESPRVRHAGLEFYMSFFQVLIAEAAPAGPAFSFRMEFTGPGGGAWTFSLTDGRCTLVESREERADLVMTQSPETFIKTFAKMHNPMLAMLTGRVKVRGVRNLGRFGKLMPSESDDMALPVNVTQPRSVAA